ncbi:MAG: OmpA family protein [Paracoccaceae bacterium]
MIFKTPFLLLSAGAIALAGCVQTTGETAPNGQTRTTNGALTGAVIGGLLGATHESGTDRVRNTVIGAGLGALAGGVVGNVLDKQAADLRSQMSGNTTVTNNGDYLTVTMPQDILFATDSANLRPDLSSDIRAVANNLMSYPNSTIEIIGHTDNVGEAAYNQDLSERRAMAVANVLRNSGVPGGRISAIGRGEDQPIASNGTANGRSQNRRVEIIIRPTN